MIKTVYSVPRLSQKEFGIFTKIADSLRKGVNKNRNEFKEAIKKLDDSAIRINLGKNKSRVLYQEAHKHKAGVVGLPGEEEVRYYVPENGGRFPEVSKRAVNARTLSGDIKKYERKKFLERGAKAKKNLESGKYPGGIIFHRKDGDEKLAHEIGHLQNRMGNNIIDRAANRLRPSLAKSIKKEEGNSLKKGFKTQFKFWVDNYEENKASKRGLRLMKKAGATKEELKLAKESFKKAGDTYKLGGKIDVKNQWASSLEELGRKIKI